MSQLVTEVFEKVGFKVGEIKGRNHDELEAICPFHKDRHFGNFYINLSSGVYHCFSCHARGVIFDLPYKDISVTEFNAAWNMIKKQEHFNIQYLNLDLVGYYESKGLSRYALTTRGMYNSTLVDYSVYADDHNNPIFFIRGFDGQYQAVWKREYDDYYLIEPDDSKTQGHLFGAHLRPTEITIVTEGFFDAMSCYQDLEEKSVSLSGTWITDAQKENLARMQPLYYMGDGDSAGRRARNIIFERTQDLEIYFCGGYTKDPDELSRAEKINVIRHAKSRMEYLQVYETSRYLV